MIETIQHIPALRDGNSAPKIIAFGHDRGARLSYRMALEAPGMVVGLAVLDIVPTPFMWSRMSLDESRHDETKKSHHWVGSAFNRQGHGIPNGEKHLGLSSITRPTA
jgi:pimeloyl-ACP methyl ester carboxylesterase